jgi:hypothetical protein
VLDKVHSTGINPRPPMGETVGMSKELCECGHPDANHTIGPCSTQMPMKDEPNRFVLCQCKKFKPKREDFSQALGSGR